MRRRDAIAGIASLGALGGAAALATRGDVPFGDESDDATDDPIEIETVDAPGSAAGTVTVPALGDVLLLDFFTTTCTVCQDMMPRLARANDRVDGVTFLSVTNPLFGPEEEPDEFAEWWNEYDGGWLLGLDADNELHERYDVVEVPTTAVIAPNGEIHWRNTGRKTVDEIVTEAEAALESSG